MRLARALVVTGLLSILRLAACTPFSGGDDDEAVDGGSDALGDATSGDGGAPSVTTCESVNQLEDKARATATCLKTNGCATCFLQRTSPRAAEFTSCVPIGTTRDCDTCAEIDQRRCGGFSAYAMCTGASSGGDLCTWIGDSGGTGRCRARCAVPTD